MAAATASTRECYICLSSLSLSELICPCRCKDDGHPRLVHRACLDRWRRNTSDSRYFTNCRECGFKFRFVKKIFDAVPEDKRSYEQRRRKALGAVIRHFAMGAILLQCVLAMLALLVRLADRKEVLVRAFNLPQRKEAPGVGEGDLLDALYYRKLTYYFCACLILAFVTGVYVSCVYLTYKCRRCSRRLEVGSAEMGRSWDGTDTLAMIICCEALGDSTCTCAECSGTCSETCGSLVPSGSSCSCGGGDCGEAGVAAACLVLVFAALLIALALIILGVVAAIMVAFTFLHRVWQKYMQVAQLRQLTSEFVVEDLSGCFVEDVDVEAVTVGAVLCERAPTQEALRVGKEGTTVVELTEHDRTMQYEAEKAIQELHGVKPWGQAAWLRRNSIGRRS